METQAISALPIALAATVGEPAFSTLSRNASANASRSTAEFCTAMGLGKAAICAGDPQHLKALAALTGSSGSDLILHSPRKVSEKYTDLHGQRFLTRSIRKHDLSICPNCWLEDLSSTGSQADGCAIRWQWLPRFMPCCSHHETALIELPYADYTTCYDHVLRAELSGGWLHRLEERVQRQALSDFERAALLRLEADTLMIDWLGDIQIDTLERWCLGLGAFIAEGTLRPNASPPARRRELTELGFSITRVGHGKLLDEVDQALGRHSTRLSKTWFHGWALQASMRDERQAFRDIMLGLIKDQGDYCLLSRHHYAPSQVQVDACIKKLAETTDRSRKWVGRALILDGFLPDGRIPDGFNVRSLLRACTAHITTLATSFGAEQSAKFLGIGITMFDGLVSERVVTCIATKAFKKPRFSIDVLDDLLKGMEAQATFHSCHAVRHDMISLSHATFVLRCPAGQILCFLEAGELPGSYIDRTAIGLSGLRISHKELLAAIRRQERSDMTLEEVRQRLALSSREIRQVVSAGLLPSERRRRNGLRAAAELVTYDELEAFLEKFQTPKTAAQHLGVSPMAMMMRIKAAGLGSAISGGDARVYERAAILKL
ncbi:hypothetical protein P775_09880 [Puniceibacterium antarcticum]|uniref:TniQ domain-containing protein n=1 Tax=Puniceibacterium antarcticum TaxID=1206336 RepID=A0A2G8RFD0_9RHOB|nr:TniQ family protein [Puniceibacterium antarcticum]PIL20250.1 hypothetical protein P775_09880 [Puniceibacterium antarcticum]